MKTNSGSLSAPVGNGAFIAFAYSIFGWALIQAWCVMLNTHIASQVAAALVGISIAALAIRRYRLQWPALRQRQSRSATQEKLINTSCSLLLLIIGYLIGELILSGWITPLVLLAAGLTLIPWSRIPLCRKYFLASVILMGTGIALTLTVSAQPVDLIRFPLAAWVLWSMALVTLLHKY